MMSGKKKELRGYVPPELEKTFRAVVVLRDTNLSDSLTEAVEDWLKKPENLEVIDADTKKIDFLLQELGLIKLADHKAQTLSGGEAQRLGFIRAIIKKADLIFLDEPFGQVDLDLRKKMYEILDFYLEKKSLVFISTHLSEDLAIDQKIEL